MDHYYVFWIQATKHGRRCVARVQPKSVKTKSQLDDWLLSEGRVEGTKYTSVMSDSEQDAIEQGIKAIQY